MLPKEQRQVCISENFREAALAFSGANVKLALC